MAAIPFEETRVLTEEGDALWAHAESRLEAKRPNPALPDLATSVRDAMGALSLFGAGVAVPWTCTVTESTIRRVSLNDRADVDVLLVLDGVQASLVKDQWHLTLNTARGLLPFVVGPQALARVFSAIDDAVANFVTLFEPMGVRLHRKHLAASTDEMLWMLDFKGTLTFVSPAFRTSTGVLLVPLCSKNGTTVFKQLFLSLGERRLASLPERGLQTIAVLNDIFRGSSVPSGLAEGLVLKVFEQLDFTSETFEAMIVFINVWRRCWFTIHQQLPLESPAVVGNLFDLINASTKQRLLEIAQEFVSCDSEKDLLEQLSRGYDGAWSQFIVSPVVPQPIPPAPSVPSPAPSASSSSTSTASPAATPTTDPVVNHGPFERVQLRNISSARFGLDGNDADNDLWQLAYQLHMGEDTYHRLVLAFEVFVEALRPNLLAALSALKSQYSADLKFFAPNVEALNASHTGTCSIGSGLDVLLCVNHNHAVSWDAKSSKASWQENKRIIGTPLLKALLTACDKAIGQTVQAADPPIELVRASDKERCYSLALSIFSGGQRYQIDINPALQSTGPFLRLCEGGAVQTIDWRGTSKLAAAACERFDGLAQVVMVGHLLVRSLAQPAKVAVPSSVFLRAALAYVETLSPDEWLERSFAAVVHGCFARLATDATVPDRNRQWFAALRDLATSDQALLDHLKKLTIPAPEDPPQ